MLKVNSNYSGGWQSSYWSNLYVAKAIMKAMAKLIFHRPLFILVLDQAEQFGVAFELFSAVMGV